MNILFMAEPYMNLHLPVIEEMKKQGHNVTYVRDEHLTFDWHAPWRGKFDKLKMMTKAFLNDSYRKYWCRRIAEEQEFSKPYDILFVINGCCLHHSLIEHLSHQSPSLNKILYLWDNSAFYEYFHNLLAELD